MKRIINGSTYNTDTATRVAMDGPRNEWSLASWELYRTRHGMFFKVVTDHDGCSQTLHPINDDDALAMLQNFAPQQVEKALGSFPEAGSAERRLTIRIPANLADRLEAAAHTRGLSLNSYAMRCFEAYASGDGQAPWKAQV